MNRDKYLTEAMGLCWHEWRWAEGDPKQGQCIKCDAWDARIAEGGVRRLDFSTWQGFGTFWEWLKNQEFRFDFINQLGALMDVLEIINPDKSADALYKFLKERREP